MLAAIAVAGALACHPERGLGPVAWSGTLYASYYGHQACWLD